MKHRGGQKVETGTYWDFDSGERVDISGEGVLPGGRGTVYYRVPSAGILLAGPFLGLLYAAFLPFIGIAMTLKLVAQKMSGSLAGSMQTVPNFAFRPSESYLAGRKRARKDEKVKEKENSQNPPEA